MNDNCAESAVISIALLHYPVYDKNSKVVTTAVTNLDIHDIARSAKTYGLVRYYIVTPVPDQKVLAGRIRDHWLTGWGAGYNPKRKDALELLRIVDSLDEVVADMELANGRPVKIITTGARDRSGCLSYPAARELLGNGAQQYLILFGTGWGLTEATFDRADYVLPPVKGPGSYNHLSVRSAAAIILDRLLGERG